MSLIIKVCVSADSKIDNRTDKCEYMKVEQRRATLDIYLVNNSVDGPGR